MGKAARWFKGIFGIKKQNLNSSSCFGVGNDKERPGFGGSGGLCHNPETVPPNLSPAEVTWLSSFYNETEEEQSRHAIAVAAATAAAADAAVAAAQAAVAVVRLTNQGRGTKSGGGGERIAAVRIQTVFRGFLARKALRALKGLVKIQALVRGFLVRKQAAATLRSMQALVRAQATVRSHKFRRQMSNENNRARKSLERFDDTRSEHLGYAHSRRLSASVDVAAVDEIPKIVEVDTGRPKSRSRRTNASVSDFSDDPMKQTLSSPAPSCRNTTPDCRSYPETEWFFAGDECRFSTAQSTPRFANSSGGGRNAPASPSKSVTGDSLFPNYMANTKSFRAKLRSYSAPKQRPFRKKRESIEEMMESRSSLSGVCSRVQEAVNFKNAIMRKLDRSADFSTGTEYSVSGNVRG